MRPTKTQSSVKSKTSTARNHPYKSQADLIREKCCIPSRPEGNIFLSSSTGHQVSESPSRSANYFRSRDRKLASQFKQPLTDEPNTIQPSEPAIFRNCCVYINGYMGPLVSDIELRRRLARHGACVVTNFARKIVTHVILGPNGLAAGKIEKEMSAKKNGVKYVTVDWYQPIRLSLS